MIWEFLERFYIREIGTPKQLPKGTVNIDAVRGYNLTRKAKKLGTFCYAPGVNMLFGQDGKVRACCHNMEFSLGEYPKQTISEIWKGDAARQLRQHMKDHDLSHGCQICQADMDTHSYEEVRARNFDSIAIGKYPTMMEFLMTNTCNLECVMCQGTYSSSIRQNREKLPPIPNVYDKKFIEQLEEFVPYLKETRFSGSGEAFAIDMNYEIWEMILRLNPGCLIMVQTNGSYLNARIKDVLSRGNFRIGVSLDSLNKETFEAIRVNASFDRIMENIRYFSNYCRERNSKFALALCVMRQNWKELPAFVKFCNEMNAVTTFHKVWFPHEYALYNLPYNELCEIYNYLSAFDLEANTSLEKLNKRHYEYIVASIKGWRDAAYPAWVAQNEFNSLTYEQLFETFTIKILQEIKAQGIPDNEIETRSNDCLYKIKRVMENYPEAERLTLMRSLWGAPADVVINMLDAIPVEELKAYAGNILS